MLVTLAHEFGFGGRDDAFAQGDLGREILDACEPDNGVDVAQAANAVFDVGFECKGWLFGMACLHFLDFAVDE